MSAISLQLPRPSRAGALLLAGAICGLGVMETGAQGFSDSAAPLRPMKIADPSALGLGAAPTASEPVRASKAKSERPAGATEITSSEGVTFDSKESKAVFTGNVVVRDPQFTLTSQRLTAYMIDGQKKDAGSGDAPEKDESAAGSPGGGGLRKAIAEGNVVIVQLKEGEGGETKKYEGRGQKVVYDAKTDEITLSGTPQVREGINVHVATSPSTVITIKSDGELVTQGPSKTVISNTKAE